MILSYPPHYLLDFSPTSSISLFVLFFFFLPSLISFADPLSALWLTFEAHKIDVRAQTDTEADKQ